MSEIEILKVLSLIAIVLYLSVVNIERWKDFVEEKEEKNKRGN